MERSAREVYGLSAGLIATGMAWAWLAFFRAQSMTPLCPTKRLLNLPCPGCGGTRAVSYLLHGHWQEAFLANPLALLVAVTGAWAFMVMLWDLVTHQRRLLAQYAWLESNLRRPQVWPVAALAVIANWIWNLYKY